VVIQLLATTLFIVAGKALGLPVDAVEWKHIRPWLVYVFAFCLGVYTNMSALSVSNVSDAGPFPWCLHGGSSIFGAAGDAFSDICLRNVPAQRACALFARSQP